MSKWIPTAMVIDRPTAVRIADDVKTFGGAWSEMFDAWQRTSLPYLLMMAHTKERIRLRAPLTALIANDDGLRTAMQEFSGQLGSVTCRWALFVEKGSEAERIVQQELLVDSVTQGNA